MKKLLAVALFVGGILIAGLADSPIGCWVMVLAVIVGALSIGTDGVSRTWPTREEGLAAYEQARKEILGDEYTPAELKAMEQAERENHNKHNASIAWWCGSRTYKDYDGIERKI